MKQRPQVPIAAATLTLLASTVCAAPKPAPRSKAVPAKPTVKGAPLPTPAAVLERLARDEARYTSGRLSIHLTERRTELPADTKPLAVRGELDKTPIASQRRDYLLFSGKSWKRDATFLDAQGDTIGHLVLGVDRNSVSRAIQEVGRAENLQRMAMIGGLPELTDADRLLLMRGADVLRNFEWKTAKPASGQIILRGTRGNDPATAVLRTAPRYALEKLMISGKTETPQGTVHRGEELKITYEIGKDGLVLKTLEHLNYVAGALNRGMLNRYKVEGAQLNVPVPGDELAVAIPEGTLVSDGRIEPPVRYPQGSQERTIAELKALQQKQLSGRARLDRPVPELELKTLDGKTTRLSEQKGKVVLLTWFASWCGPCHLEAPQMEKEFWQKYRDQGLMVYGVNTEERMDPHEMAKGFVRQHSLTYPVLMDVDREATELFGVRGLPTLAVIDRKGVLRYVQPGFDKDAALQQVEALLAEQP